MDSRTFALQVTIVSVAFPALSLASDMSAALDQEARQVAQSAISSHFTSQCGGDVFSQFGNSFWQYERFRWSVKRAPLTYQDVLSGVVWRGDLKISASAYRRHDGARWGPWHLLQPILISMQKKNGVWNVEALSAEAMSFGDSAPECEDLPGVRLYSEKRGGPNDPAQRPQRSVPGPLGLDSEPGKQRGGAPPEGGEERAETMLRQTADAKERLLRKGEGHCE